MKRIDWMVMLIGGVIGFPISVLIEWRVLNAMHASFPELYSKASVREAVELAWVDFRRDLLQGWK